MHRHRGKQKRNQGIAIALTSSVALLAGIWMPNPQAKSPPSVCPSPQRSPRDSGAEDSRVAADPSCGDRPSASSEASEFLPLVQHSNTLLQQVQTAERKINKQLNGKPYWEQAQTLALEAVALAKTDNPSIDRLQDIKSLWSEAISSLRQVPPDSDYSDRAAAKIREYQTYYNAIAYDLEVAQSDFLIPIAQNSGLSSRVKITICHVTSRICRRLRGNEPARDAASLMKVPIAVALMHKLTTEKMRLDAPIYVDPGNYTEDASPIRVGRNYPVEELLKEAIAHSSNIAPNQIIDYLGWDYINQVLQKRGFEITRVYSKFVGNRTYPQNVAIGRNQTTSDELTEMMLQIYNREHLGDEILIRALEDQYDRALGFAGIKVGFGNWLGEKTGQTSRVLGTTLAMNLFGETYIITVIDDGFYSEPSIRRFITEISEHIFRSGQL